MEMEAFPRHGVHSMIQHLARGIRVFDFVSCQRQEQGHRIGGKVYRGDQICRRTWI